jgi:hypothetical protein
MAGGAKGRTGGADRVGPGLEMRAEVWF